MRRLGNPARDTFNVPYDLFPPLLIKLLITFGCYRHRGDIPQVLSAARAPENPRRGTPFSPPPHLQSFRLTPAATCAQQGRSIYTLQPTVPSPKQRYFLPFHRPPESQSVLFNLASRDTNGFFHCPSPLLLPPRHPSPFVGPPLWLHCRGFCSPSSCLEMRTRHGPLRAFTRYCYVSKPIN